MTRENFDDLSWRSMVLQFDGECIHCGKKGFKDVEEVIKHIKSGCKE